MGNNGLAPFDIKKSLKKGMIFMLIAIPLMLVVSVLLNIAKAPFWLNLLSTVIVGGVVILLCFVVDLNKKQKIKDKKQAKDFDPFKD